MGKKFSIIRTLDFGKLNYEIDSYQTMAGETNPYLFMNKNTVDMVINPYKEFNIRPYKIHEGDCISCYSGYKVFIDNDLKLGEIEVR